MHKPHSYTISRRITKALLILTCALSIIFTAMMFMMVYVVEDRVFVNMLNAEHQYYKKLDAIQAKHWQPLNRDMKLVTEYKNLPSALQKVIYKENGVYEYFKESQAYFVLYNHRKTANSQTKKPYYLTYDVSDLLSVRSARNSIIVTVMVVSLIVILMAILIAVKLSKKILQPLKKLTEQLHDHDHIDISKGFSKPFAGDEIGTLAEQLELALQNVQKTAQKAFEFNRGVSHELRSPIQVAINATELLSIQHQQLDQSATMDRLKRAIIQMQKISQAFLWLVSERSLEYKKTNITDLIKELTLNYQDTKIIVQQPHGPLYYPVPQAVLSVILDSLINNAIVHGDQNNHQDEISVIISDSWFSISNSNEINQPNDANNQKSFSGYGIGLMIVKSLCQKLNWQISQQNHQSDLFCITVTNIKPDKI